MRRIGDLRSGPVDCNLVVGHALDGFHRDLQRRDTDAEQPAVLDTTEPDLLQVRVDQQVLDLADLFAVAVQDFASARMSWSGSATMCSVSLNRIIGRITARANWWSIADFKATIRRKERSRAPSVYSVLHIRHETVGVRCGTSESTATSVWGWGG